jgi:toluene monooxygenase system ferredoxin subunit
MSFRIAMHEDDLWSGEMRGLVLGTTKVLLVKVGGEVRAYEDRCAHQAIALSKGKLEGHVLTCFAHEWQYDVRSGLGINPCEVRLRALPTRIDHHFILVDVDDVVTR